MSKKSFEEAKQLVAEKYGRRNWSDLVRDSEYFVNLANIENEAAELMSKSWANEAVKEERSNVGHFDTCKKMALESPIGEIIVLPDVIEVTQDKKKGGRIIVGVPEDTVYKLLQGNGKWIYQMLLIKNEEYQKVLKELQARPLPYPETEI